MSTEAAALLPLILILGVLLNLPAAAAELKLATWNIAWLTLRPVGDPTLPRSLPRRDEGDLDRLAAYAERLDADIVALQEVDGPAAAARIFDRRTYAFFFPAEDDVQRTGFAVRRTLTVRQNPDLAALDLRPRARLSLRRGTDITVATPGGELRLLSLHLGAGCRDGDLAAPRGEDCTDFARQAAIVADWVAARSRDGVAFAVLGDLNRRIVGDDDPFLALIAPAGSLVRPAAGRSSPCWADSGGGRPFIDHLLLDRAAAGWLVPDSLRVLVFAERGGEWRNRLSDHCPVSVRLRPTAAAPNGARDVAPSNAGR